MIAQIKNKYDLFIQDKNISYFQTANVLTLVV